MVQQLRGEENKRSDIDICIGAPDEDSYKIFKKLSI